MAVETEGDYMTENVPVSAMVEFMYLVFTRMPGESYGRRLRFVVIFV